MKKRRRIIPLFVICIILTSCEQSNDDANDIWKSPIICVSDNQNSIIFNDLGKERHSYVNEDNEADCFFTTVHGFYNLPNYYSVSEIVSRFGLGHTLSFDEEVLCQTGDIGDIKSVYKNIDLNGDGEVDKIIRKASAEMEKGTITVDYRISVTNGVYIDVPTISDTIGSYAGGGEVFEFFDINEDGYTEVLFSKYAYTTKGYKIQEAILYYIYNNRWENFDFTTRLEDIVGIQLMEDGQIAVLVDYGDKWNSFLDTFLFKMNGAEIYCSDNGSAYIEIYWPIVYQNTESPVSFLGNEAKGLLSGFIRDVYINEKLPDEFDVSDYIEALEVESDLSTSIVIIPIDFGLENEFGVYVKGWFQKYNENDSNKEFSRIYVCNTDSKDVFCISDNMEIVNYYENGYVITYEHDGYYICKYDSAKREFYAIDILELPLSDEEIINIVGNNELIGNYPQIYLNKNINLYKELNSGLEIIDYSPIIDRYEVCGGVFNKMDH